jgi:hypothetical protein
MAEDDYERDPEVRRRECEAFEDGAVDDVSRDPDDEEVPESLVEDDLRDDARVRAPQDGCERPLPAQKLRAPLGGSARIRGTIFDETPISFFERGQRLICRHLELPGMRLFFVQTP